MSLQADDNSDYDDDKAPLMQELEVLQRSFQEVHTILFPKYIVESRACPPVEVIWLHFKLLDF